MLILKYLQSQFMEQSTTNLIEDIIFTWQSVGHTFDSKCRLRIYQLECDRTVIIVSQLPNNTGRSITNAAEHLIQLVRFQYNLTPAKMMWIEHYPSYNIEDEDTYYEVRLVNGEATWNPTNKNKLETILNVLL
jgi:hypothetical protein